MPKFRGGIILTSFLFIIFNIIQAQMLDESNLKDLLTPTEWNSLMGTSRSDVIFEIVEPKLSNGFSRVKTLSFNTTRIGRLFNIQLNPSGVLASPNFVAIETFANRSNVITSNEFDYFACFYRGEKAALDICNGIHGIIQYNANEVFYIRPLPARFQNETFHPHVIIAQNIENNLNLYNKTRTKGEGFHHLSKRNSFPAESPVFVETAIFVDKDLYEHMKSNFPSETEKELIRFVLAMINAVQLLYHDPSLGRPVNFLLKRLEILKEEASGLSRPPDIDRYLSNFCNWQRTKTPSEDSEPQHWDHALILTGLDLYVRGKHGKISNQVVGLAPVAGMCTSTSSCTVNEGRHFESVYVVAHEIGHNLGMRHDGPLADNDCDPSSFIMSPTLGSGKITWSACSRRYLQKFLETPQSRCLLDHGSSAGQLDHRAEGALPGERFDADQQCILKYGRGSRHSIKQPLDDVCRDLHCERDRYTWTSHPALEGTMCGHNLWCRGGRCIIRSLLLSANYISPQKSLARLEAINGGWSKWRSTSDCASGCLYGEEGRLRSGSSGIKVSTRVCNNPSPQGGGYSCDGYDRKYQACHAQQCLNVPRLTVHEFVNQICSRAKEVDKDLNGTGIQRISTDPEEACLVWCHKNNGGTKSRGWTFPDGTVCQMRKNKYFKQSYCVNGRCEDFVCDVFDETQFVQNPDLCPTNREDNEVTYRTGLSLRESSNKSPWVSASGCHFNCITPGIGIRLVYYKTTKDRSSIQICQPNKLGCAYLRTTLDYASLVCSKYKDRVRRLSGLGMQLTSVLEDPDRACHVACQDETILHRFYIVNGEEGWFPFGTECSRGMADKAAYCIGGKCLEFGLNDVPQSQSEFTLPLLSRNKRSLNKNSSRVTVTLTQGDLDKIIEKLNETIIGKYKPDFYQKIDIDLNNPIQVDMDLHSALIPHKYYRKHEFYYYDGFD